MERYPSFSRFFFFLLRVRCYVRKPVPFTRDTATGQKSLTLGALWAGTGSLWQSPPSPSRACEHWRLHPVELGVNCSLLQGCG